MQANGKIRYYQAPPPPAPPPMKRMTHTEFLRIGYIPRGTSVWVPTERRYLSYEDVAARTGKKLEAAGEKSHERINAFHRSIQFPKIIFHHTLAGRPHLGYCHVTAARTLLARRVPVSWSFYIANFFSEIGEEERFFERISTAYSRMYFAVAIEGEPGEPLRLDRSIRKSGLLFKTNDPMEAIKNVLTLGASNERLRELIKKL